RSPAMSNSARRAHSNRDRRSEMVVWRLQFGRQAHGNGPNDPALAGEAGDVVVPGEQLRGDGELRRPVRRPTGASECLLDPSVELAVEAALENDVHGGD